MRSRPNNTYACRRDAPHDTIGDVRGLVHGQDLWHLDDGESSVKRVLWQVNHSRLACTHLLVSLGVSLELAGPWFVELTWCCCQFALLGFSSEHISGGLLTYALGVIPSQRTGMTRTIRLEENDNSIALIDTCGHVQIVQVVQLSV